MFERFTDRARKVMALANQEAQRFNHEYIGTEHMLLGLVKEGSGIGAIVLKRINIDLRKVRLEVEKLVRGGPDMVTMGKLPHTPRAKRAIQDAILEARNLNHNYVGTEHLLLGLLLEPDGVACQVLKNLGVSIENVRKELHSYLKEPPKTDNPINMPIHDSDNSDRNIFVPQTTTYNGNQATIQGTFVSASQSTPILEQFKYCIVSVYFNEDTELIQEMNNIGKLGGEIIHLDIRDACAPYGPDSPRKFVKMIIKTRIK